MVGFNGTTSLFLYIKTLFLSLLFISLSWLTLIIVRQFLLFFGGRSWFHLQCQGVTELHIFVWPLHRIFLWRDYQGHPDQGNLCCHTFSLRHWAQWQLLKVTTYRSKLPREKLPKHFCLVTQSRMARTSLICPSWSFTIDHLPMRPELERHGHSNPLSKVQPAQENMPSSASAEGDAVWEGTQREGNLLAFFFHFLFF